LRAASLIYHEDFKLHDPSPYPHPESPSRLDIAIRALSHLLDSGVLRLVQPTEGDPMVFADVHTSSYVEMVLSAGAHGVEWLDPDTYVSPGTLAAVRRLAGAVEEASHLAEYGVDTILLARPPGHHAGRSGRGMGAPTQGFCLLNTVAYLAMELRCRGYKPAILDFDVHHGNGTQDILYSTGPLHVDIHQDSATIYPGTGFPEQVGVGGGRGLMVNINLPPGSGDDIGLHAVELAFERITGYDPDIIIVSMGFDGFEGDNPMASLRLGRVFYYAIGSKLASLDLASVVLVLEGGYGKGLSDGLASLLSGFLGIGSRPGDASTSRNREWEWYKARLEQLSRALGGWPVFK